MEGIPLARASQLIQIAEALEGRGLSAERILSQAQLPMWHDAQPDELIPTRHIWLFMRQAARAAGDPAFGHRVGESDPLGALGALGTRLRRSPTVYQALQICCRQVRAHTSNVRCWLGEAGAAHIWFGCNMAAIDVGLTEMEQCIVMQMIRIVRLGAGPEWRPTRVRLQAGPVPGLGRTSALSEADLQYRRPATAIAVPRAVLPLPLGVDPRRGAARQGPTMTRYRSSAPADDLAESIRQLIGAWLPQGYPRIEVAAEAAGVQVRALQRRLAQDGLTYRELIEEARFAAATRLLGDPEAKITAIALELGYGDPANFSHAFQRWAGVSPRQFRRLRAH